MRRAAGRLRRRTKDESIRRPISAVYTLKGRLLSKIGRR
jgi:hypothetical protein